MSVLTKEVIGKSYNGLRDTLYNPIFNHLEFEGFRSQAGLNVYFYMLAGINADDLPPTWPDRISIPVRVLCAATKWWHECVNEAVVLKDV